MFIILHTLLFLIKSNILLNFVFNLIFLKTSHLIVFLFAVVIRYVIQIKSVDCKYNRKYHIV